MVFPLQTSSWDIDHRFWGCLFSFSLWSCFSLFGVPPCVMNSTVEDMDEILFLDKGKSLVAGSLFYFLVGDVAQDKLYNF